MFIVLAWACCFCIHTLVWKAIQRQPKVRGGGNTLQEEVEGGPEEESRAVSLNEFTTKCNSTGSLEGLEIDACYNPGVVVCVSEMLCFRTSPVFEKGTFFTSNEFESPYIRVASLQWSEHGHAVRMCAWAEYKSTWGELRLHRLGKEKSKRRYQK